MRAKCLQVWLVAGCFAVAGLTSSAQQVVHALAGTVKNVNQQAGTIVIATDDGSPGFFRDAKPNASVGLDKSVSADSTPVDKFTEKGTQVIVYYFEDGNNQRTAVAVHPLGDASLEKSTGTIVKFDKREHVVTIKDSAGAEESFHFDAKTVADTTTGVVEGNKFTLDKGSVVRVIAAPVDGSETLLFIALS